MQFRAIPNRIVPQRLFILQQTYLSFEYLKIGSLVLIVLVPLFSQYLFRFGIKHDFTSDNRFLLDF